MQGFHLNPVTLTATKEPENYTSTSMELLLKVGPGPVHI